MRHRMVKGLGFGNPDPVILDNKGKLHDEFALRVLGEFFSDFEYFDYHVDKDKVIVGIEPAYQYEKLRIICITKNKKNSYIRHGKAMGPYGSKILGPTRYYRDYVRNSKFKRLVDDFHSKLFKK